MIIDYATLSRVIWLTGILRIEDLVPVTAQEVFPISSASREKYPAPVRIKYVEKNKFQWIVILDILAFYSAALKCAGRAFLENVWHEKESWTFLRWFLCIKHRKMRAFYLLFCVLCLVCLWNINVKKRIKGSFESCSVHFSWRQGSFKVCK